MKRWFSTSLSGVEEGGGFRLYPMRFDPKTTDETTKKKMLEKLHAAVALLEKV